MGKGIHTREYTLFHSNIPTMTDHIKSNIEKVATEALAKDLIGSESHENAINTHNSSYMRASTLVQIFRSRIEQYSEEFYVILEIFWNIAALKKLATTVDPEYKGPQAHTQSSAKVTNGTAHSTSSEVTSSQQVSLKIEDKRKVAEQLIGIAAEWESIAIALDLSDNDVDIIKKDNQSDCKPCLYAVIKLWLNGKGGPRTWLNLSEAVGGPLVGKPDEAAKIKKTYC